MAVLVNALLYLASINSKVRLAANLPIVLMSITFLVAAFLSGGDYYAAKQSLFFLVLTFLFLVSAAALINDDDGYFRYTITLSVILLVAVQIIYTVMIEGGFYASTDNKNIVGAWAFLGVVLAGMYHLSTNRWSAYVFLILMCFASIIAFSAKYFFPTVVLFIYTVTKGRAVFKTVLIALLLLSVYLFLNFDFHSYVEFLYRLLSKNLAIFDESFPVGQSAVTNRLALISDSVKNDIVIRRYFILVYISTAFILMGQRFWDSIPIMLIFVILFSSPYFRFEKMRRRATV